MRLLSCLPRDRLPRVLTTGSEFMSFSRQMARFEEEKLISVTRMDTEPFDSFEERFSREARGDFDLVYISQVFFDSAFAIDPAFVARTAHNQQSLIVIDGYHGFMAIPTDLRAIAERVFYVAGGYKYAMAGEGACFLHCPPGFCPRPRDTGWYAGFSALEKGGSGVPFAEDGSRFFGATFDVSGLYRFNAVQEWMSAEGLSVTDMLAHVRSLERLFIAELDRLRAPVNSTVLLVPEEKRRGRFLAFRAREAGHLASRLAAENIIVDYRGDRLRIGFGIYHEAGDAIRLAEAIAKNPVPT
jgi:selenocysteine lyase/cysteine desulfurase